MYRDKLFLCIFALLVMSSATLAIIPRLINYQGKLLDSNQQPVAEGIYKLTFGIYDVNGAVKWTEVHEKVVSNSRGCPPGLCGA